ncbi:MAG: hypothetical protein U0Q12_14540 [Vicinamibacterales bacterium]
MQRKLLFGVSLISALLSMYAGIYEWGKFLQYGLVGLCVVVAVAALLSPEEDLSTPPSADRSRDMNRPVNPSR